MVNPWGPREEVRGFSRWSFTLSQVLEVAGHLDERCHVHFLDLVDVGWLGVGGRLHAPDVGHVLQLEQRVCDENLHGLEVRLAGVLNLVVSAVKELTYLVVILDRVRVLDGQDYHASRGISDAVDGEQVGGHAEELSERFAEVEFGAGLTSGAEHVQGLHVHFVRDGGGRDLAQGAEVEASGFIDLAAQPIGKGDSVSAHPLGHSCHCR